MMAEFAKLEHFDKIRYYTFSGTGYIDLKTIKIKTQDPNEIMRRYGLYVPLYGDKTTGTYQGENSRGQIPTGTYIVLNGDDDRSASVSGIIFTTAKRDGRGASAIYYNEGVSFFISEIFGATLYKADIFAAYHPPALPIFVGTKRVNKAICKVGGVLKTVQSVYVKKDGVVKKIM